MNDILPAEVRSHLRTRAYRTAILKLASLLELRPIVEDAKAEGERVLMKLYAEAAEDMMVHPDTVRADLNTIRNYPPEKLAYWITNKAGFSHIEMANSLQEIAKKPAAQLLDECITLGNESGKTMTVNELIVFALGEQKRDPALFRVKALFERLGKLPNILGWAETKVIDFNKWLDYGRENFL